MLIFDMVQEIDRYIIEFIIFYYHFENTSNLIYFYFEWYQCWNS